ncbi:hypothetical protein ACO0RG_003201 [Hanseniaspora osmophila]
MAATLMGSPEKSHSALKQRYLQSLQNTGMSLEPLKPSSSTRISSLSGSPKRHYSSVLHKSPVKNDLHKLKQEPAFVNQNSIKPSSVLNSRKLFELSSSKEPLESQPSPKLKQQKQVMSKNASIKSPSKATEMPDLNNFSSKSNIDHARSVTKISSNFEKVDTKKYSPIELKYYEFLCRVYEAKEWMESIIDEELPSVMSLVTRNALQDGVALAKIAQKVNSSLVPQVHPSTTKFKYKLLENIENFLLLVDTVDVPNNFKFESTDLYDGKNIPQVFETLHALAFTLHQKWPKKVPAMINEFGLVNFSKDDLRDCKIKFPHLKNFQFFGHDHHSPNKKKPQNHEQDLIPNLDDVDRQISNKAQDTQNDEQLQESRITETSDLPFAKINPTKSYSAFNSKYTKELALDDDLEKSLKLSQTIDKMDDNRISSVVVKNPLPVELLVEKDTNDLEASLSSSFNYSSKLKDIPVINYAPRQDLSYYSPSISAQISPRRRRRRRANMYSAENQFDSSLSSSGSEYSNPFSSTGSYAASDQYSYSEYQPSSVHEYDLLFPKKRTGHAAQNTHSAQNADLISKVQGICRGSNTRYALYALDLKLEFFEEEITAIQACLKSKILLQSIKSKLQIVAASNESHSLAQFQAYIKGSQIRFKYDRRMFDLSRHHLSVDAFQALTRGYAVRQKSSKLQNSIVEASVSIQKLQSLIKGGNARLEFNQITNFLTLNIASIVKSQAIVKAGIARKKINAQMNCCAASRSTQRSIILLQAYVKGSLHRKNAGRTERSLNKSRNKSALLIGCIRGAIFRDSFYETLYNIENFKEEASSLQAQLKGVLARYAVQLLDNVIDTHSVSLLQSHVRGGLKRIKIKQTSDYYNGNVKAVITLQSRIRSFALEKAYHELMDFANPSLWALKKFAFLLNGVQPTYETQDTLDNLKEAIDKKNIAINKSDLKLRNTGEKLSVLKSSGVIKHSLNPEVGNILQTLKGSVNFENCETIAYFEKIFYLLQVDPFYFRLLFSVEPKTVKKFLILLFFKRDGSISSREGLLYMKLVSELLLVDVESRAHVSDFLLEQFDDEPWKQLLNIFLLAKHKNLMNSLFSGLIKALDSLDVSFEGNPSKIYQSLYGLDKDVDPKEAIEDKATNAQYITNMCTLWSFIEQVHGIILSNIDNLPIEVLHLCTKAYTAVAGKSSDEFDALEAISKVIIGAFVNSYLLQFDAYGVQLQHTNHTVANLEILSDALSTVFAMRKFKGFYSQLNSYVEAIGNEIAATLQHLQITPAYEEQMESMVYEDMNKCSRPILTINIKYLSEIVDFIYQNIEMLPQDDPLVELLETVQDLGNTSLFTRSSVVNLELNPSAYILCDVSDRGRPVFNNVMWGLIYVIQICSAHCSSVLDVLSKPEEEDEDVLEMRFQNLLSKYPSLKENAVFKELPSVSYFELKMYVTEKTLELSNMSFIDRSGNFQCLLNDIANTIKCHVYVKTRNMKEIDIAERTLGMLETKHQKISHEYQLLKQSFDTSLGGVKPVVHFNAKKKGLGSKLKGMVHTKNNKDLSSTRYKWSLRQLYEKGILLGIEGEKLESLPVNYFGGGGAKFPNVDFVFSTSNGKEYIIEMIDNRKNHGSARTSDRFNFESVLERQMNSSAKEMMLANNKAKFNTKKLFKMIVESFLS